MMRSFIVSAVMIVFLTACATPFWSRTSPEPPLAEMDVLEAEGTYEGIGTPIPALPLSMELRFADVPVPAGASLDLEKTYVHESADLQIGKMVYTSKATVEELVNFYLHECGAAGWKKVMRTDADGAELVFKKSGQRLTVTIRPLGVGRSRLLIVHLTPEAE